MSGAHALMTICAAMAIDPGFASARDRDLEEMIDRLGNPAEKLARTRLDETMIVHFMSLHVIRGRTHAEPSFLVMEVSADGRERDVIEAVCAAIGDELLVIYRHAFGVSDLDELKRFLSKHNRPLSRRYVRRRSLAGLPFVGLEGLSVERIRREEKVVAATRDALGALAGSATEQQSALAHLKHARTHLAADCPEWRKTDASEEPELAFVDSDDAPWLAQPKTPTLWGYARLTPSLFFAAALIIGLIWLVVWGWFSFGAVRTYVLNGETATYLESIEISLAASLMSLVMALSLSLPFALIVVAFISALAYASLRGSEARNKPNDLDPDPAIVREIMLRENDPCSAQNHMISVCDIIPEWSRRWFTLPFAMNTIGTALEQRLFRGGFLADIGTIHFARWVVLPGTNRLVFFSNYDGSWESYLEDFIAKASPGLTGVWSNCVGFPKTERLFFEGAVDGDRFKRWARRSMQPTRFWYSAYPHLTAQQIRTSALICDGLRKITTASDAEAWLELFDSIPRPEAHLEDDEIQALLLRGMGEMREVRCIGVRFEEGNARAWIGALAKEVLYGRQGSHKADSVSFVALSAPGLAALGVDEAKTERTGPAFGSRASFPAPFVLGMDDESRQRVLGDFDENAPAAWAWGHAAGRLDAVLLIYAKDLALMERARAKAIERIKEFGLSDVQEVAMGHEAFGANGQIYEAFRYADGISDPLIGHGPTGDRLHGAAAGEFILGYRDNRGFFAPALLIPAEKDPLAVLPGPPARAPKRWPQFRRRTGEEAFPTRDFGRNGSFLVIRQLEQRVELFDEWLWDVAEGLSGARRNEQPKVVEGHLEYAAAKVMGRWRTGVSLIKAPHGQGREAAPDNDFVYGRDDPQGHLCPFGAHIRRANPRDSLNPDRPEELDIVNRHRLLRRGRPYKAGNEQGMLFMCLNADIERQFEFVQQNWINASSHHGLRGEHDPVASHLGKCSFTMPAPDGAPVVVHRPKAFVRVRGGGYFFMPSRTALKYLATLPEVKKDEVGASKALSLKAATTSV